MLSTSVAGRRSCLASSLRSSRAERGSGARIATGRPSRDARGRERITGGSSPPQSSRGFIALALPSWFSRPVAGRRSCLASSLSSPFRAERGSGARIATGNVRATHAARMHRGWFLTAAIDQGGLVRCCVCESAVSSSRPRSSIRARRSLAPLPAPAAGGRGAPTSSRPAAGGRCAVGWCARVPAPRARSMRTPLLDCGGDEPPVTHARRARIARRSTATIPASSRHRHHIRSNRFRRCRRRTATAAAIGRSWRGMVPLRSKQ